MNLQFLLDFAVKSAMLIALLLPVAIHLRRRRPDLAHLVLTCALTVCLLLPIVQAVVRPSLVASPVHVTELQDSGRAPTAPSAAPIHAQTGAQTLPAIDPIPIAWLIGAVSCLVYGMLGRARACILYRNSAPLEAGAIAKVRIASSACPATAVTWGSIRPAILLPASSACWSHRELRSAIDHELAHVRRRDDLAHSIGWLAACLNWFNPLVWVAVREQRVAAELAADGVVAASRRDPAEYARDLLNIAAKTSRLAALPSFGVTMLNSTNIEHRIKAILSRRAPRRIGAVTVTISLAAAAIAVAALGPLRSAGPAHTGTENIESLSSRDWAIGQSSNLSRSRPKLVFFADFECPACRQISPVVLKLRDSGYGMVLFHFPLRQHSHARLAAQAMVAASRQGAEWRACQELFTMKLTDDSIRLLGSSIGINERRFLADLDSDATRQRVQDSIDLGRRLKLNQVPTFFTIDPNGKAERIDSKAVRELAH